MKNQPIILLGAARSGTKFLRDCLAASPGLVAVPYDVNYVWRFGQETLAHDVLDPKELTPKTRKFIHKTLPKLAAAGPDDELIEKTVSNTLRLLYVEAVYPQARYVHLIRDGREVTESAMRLWTQPPETGALLKKLRSMPLANIGYVLWYARNMLSGILGGGRKGGKVWGPRYPGIDKDVEQKSLAQVCSWQWRHCVESTLVDLEKIDTSRVFTIRYEDLVASPDAIKALAADLGLQEPETCAAALAQNLRENKGQPAWTKLPKDDKDAMEYILKKPLQRLGYLS